MHCNAGDMMFRLATTLLAPAIAPADALVAIYP